MINSKEMIESELVDSLSGLAESKTAEAIRYSLDGGGKRVRPVLLLEFFAAWSQYCTPPETSKRIAFASAAAVEMIHSFSLIHDDMPCMDDDEYRRGKPATHAKFGEAAALLAGDALAVEAFRYIAVNGAAEPGKALRLVSELSKYSGANGMILGQDMDLSLERTDSRAEDVRKILLMYKHKTCDLLKFSCRAGAICAGASEKAVDDAGLFAENLGLAFQLIDDIIDEIPDRSAKKLTYVSLVGSPEARKTASDYTAGAIKMLENVPNNEHLIKIARALLGRK